MRFAFAFSVVSSLPLPSTVANTTSASATAAGMSVEKKRFLPSVSATTSLSPGS